MPQSFGRLLAVATITLVLGACSDEEPPGWLQDLAADAQTTTAALPAPTTVVGGPERDGTTTALALETGNCIVEAPFTEGAPVEVVSLPTVHCRRPHQAEVYDVVQLPQRLGEPFPGDALVARAHQACLERFEPFVGIAWTASELDFVSLRPSEVSWEQGDRAVACVLFRPDGKDLEGSARGAAY